MKRKDVLIGLLLAFSISILFVPFASQSPDGLEKVAAEQGFASKENENPSLAAPFADYRIPGISDKNVSAAISGVIGALAVFCTAGGISALLKRRKPR